MHDFTGWHIWAESISTLESTELSVADLDLADEEHITAIAFEHGRVEAGFGTNAFSSQEWDRRERYWESDFVELPIARETTFDLLSAIGTTKTEQSEIRSYAPALLHMQATSSPEDGETADLWNDAAIDIHRNLELHDQDEDSVVQAFNSTTPEEPEEPASFVGYLPKTDDIAKATPALAALAAASAGVWTARKTLKRRKRIAFIRKNL